MITWLILIYTRSSSLHTSLTHRHTPLHGHISSYFSLICISFFNILTIYHHSVYSHLLTSFISHTSPTDTPLHGHISSLFSFVCISIFLKFIITQFILFYSSSSSLHPPFSHTHTFHYTDTHSLPFLTHLHFLIPKIYHHSAYSHSHTSLTHKLSQLYDHISSLF